MQSIVEFLKIRFNNFMAVLKKSRPDSYDEIPIDGDTDFRMLMAGMSFFAPAMIDEVLIRWHVTYGFNGFEALYNELLLWFLLKFTI